MKRDVKEKDAAKHEKEEEKPPKKRKTKTEGGSPSTEAPLTKKTKPAYGICRWKIRNATEMPAYTR